VNLFSRLFAIQLRAEQLALEGWEYSPVFTMKFHAKERKMDLVRRRRWHRKMVQEDPSAPAVFHIDVGSSDDVRICFCAVQIICFCFCFFSTIFFLLGRFPVCSLWSKLPGYCYQKVSLGVKKTRILRFYILLTTNDTSVCMACVHMANISFAKREKWVYSGFLWVSKSGFCINYTPQLVEKSRASSSSNQK